MRQTARKRYGTLIADPPWDYNNKRLNGTVDKHYSTMTLDDLCRMPVPLWTKTNCVLFMWGTWPHVPSAMQLGRSWGFNYVTGFPWVKLERGSSMQAMQPDLFTGEAPLRPMFGTGWWVRGCSEYVLIWRKGKPKLPSIKYLGLLGERFEHSKKPENVHQIAETLDGPYLELFARAPRDGWDVFGNEVEGSIDLTGAMQLG